MNAVLPTKGMTPRKVVHRTRGSSHGPIARLMSPSDLGQRLKPFVFLDRFEVDPNALSGSMPLHPHSGIPRLADRLRRPLAGSIESDLHHGVRLELVFRPVADTAVPGRP
jgi:hypothetical protein